MSTEPRLRIGEFSRRVGVSDVLLRAWERRYGVPSPERTDSGLRLYSDADLRAVEAMRAHLEAGLSAAEAASAVRDRALTPDVPADGRLHDAARRLRAAFDAYEDAPAQLELDRLLSQFGLETVVVDVILPYLRELGDRWARGEATVAQEHFTSAVIHGRLVGLARGWDAGFGPRAVLACAPGEQHTLGLLCFGLLLRAKGWRLTYLGGDTPLADVRDAADAVAPHAVVVSAVDAARLRAAAAELRGAAGAATLAIGGAGATGEAADATGALLLDADPAVAAQDLTARLAIPLR